MIERSRLALKLFRGEPAISGFDWHFTPIHSSSHAFSTTTWFGPPRAFTPVSPWPWVAHPVSCLILATKRPIQTRFRYGYGCDSLNLATKINSQAHSPRGTPLGIAPRTRVSPEHRRAISPSTACKLTVSGSISLPSLGYFSPFPHGTCSLSVAKCI